MVKLADQIARISGRLTTCYRSVEHGVVSGYKAVESSAVGIFTRVSDKCVEVLFAKQGESVEAAKARLRKHNEY